MVGSAVESPFNFSFYPGLTYLIQSKSGSGKSLLLRTIAGIWPYAEGKIFIPNNKSIVFIPQKPYLPLGSLKEILLAENNSVCSDAELKRFLKDIHLEQYTDKLHDVENWQQILSLGEQQLLFLAHIFIKKPDIIFLDESTSALNEQAETYFYQSLQSKLPNTTVISVGHRSTLQAFHRHTITLNREKNQYYLEDQALNVT